VRNSVVVFSTFTGRKISELDTGAGIHDAAFSFDGKLYCVAFNDGTCRIWDTGTAKEVANFNTGAGYSCSVVFSRDGKTVVADDGRRAALIVYSVTEKKEKKRVNGQGTSYTSISPNGRYVIASARGTWIVDVKDDKQIREILPHMASKVAMSPDSRFVVAHDSQGHLIKWDLATGQEAMSVQMDYLSWPEYSPDGRWVAGTDGAGAILILDARTFAVVRKIPPDPNREDGGSHIVTFTRDGLHLLGFTSTGRIRIYSSH
jgi:WD40 repeat protein